MTDQMLREVKSSDPYDAVLSDIRSIDPAYEADVACMKAHTIGFALALGYPKGEALALGRTAALHDIGKLLLPRAILDKPGPLDRFEWIAMRRHPEIGFEMLMSYADTDLASAAAIALTHHERWDGKGYPRGLSGEQIPLEARIATITDVFDALTADRAYRGALSAHEALEIMSDGRGTHLDPDLLDVFVGDHVEAAPPPPGCPSPLKGPRKAAAR